MSNLGHNYKLFGLFFLGFLFFLWAIYPYLQAEILTNFYISKFDIIRVCQKNEQKSEIINNSQNNSTRQKQVILKNAKLITYNPERNEAVIDCLYIDSDENIRINLALRKTGWEVVFVTLLNKERSFYWPIYN